MVYDFGGCAAREKINGLGSAVRRVMVKRIHFEAIMAEIDQLNLEGDRIEGLADHHPHVSEALITIAMLERSDRSHSRAQAFF